MKAIKTDTTTISYKGPTPDIFDLPCERVKIGQIRSFWRPSPEELAILNDGGCVEIDLLTEPIPPIAVNVSTKTEYVDPFAVNLAEWKKGIS
jgi:hypothetical protein